MKKEQNWIFFDIDGTLLYARGIGRETFPQAFREALDWDQRVDHVNFHGATDLDVFRNICLERGETATAAMEQAFFDRLAPALDEQLALQPPEVYPNIKNLLPILSEDWNLGIVTGNVEPTARIKLKHAGLLDFFNPSGFGCGCDHADRVEIARHALERAGNPEKAILIGDTPNDVNAAKANGIVAVAVATGGFSFEELEQTDADYVFEDLTDTARLLSILNSL